MHVEFGSRFLPGMEENENMNFLSFNIITTIWLHSFGEVFLHTGEMFWEQATRFCVHYLDGAGTKATSGRGNAQKSLISLTTQL